MSNCSSRIPIPGDPHGSLNCSLSRNHRGPHWNPTVPGGPWVWIADGVRLVPQAKALEETEKRVEKLRAAIQAARASEDCPCDECLSDRLDLALKEG